MEVYCFALANHSRFIGLVIYALGSALPVFTLSLVRMQDTSETGSTNGQDYGLVVLSKTFGVLFGLPVMTLLWTKGIAIGGVALGLPYFGSAASKSINSCFTLLTVLQMVYSVAGLLVWRLRWNRGAQS
jgi:hypothetical protein